MKKFILLALLLALTACKKETARLGDDVIYDNKTEMYVNTAGKPFTGTAVMKNGEITITIQIKKGLIDGEHSIRNNEQYVLVQTYKKGVIQNIKFWNDAGYMESEVIFTNGEPSETVCYDSGGKVVYTHPGGFTEGQTCRDYSKE